MQNQPNGDISAQGFRLSDGQLTLANTILVSPKIGCKSMQRYRAVVEGIIETRRKVAICESMKADAARALADADKSLSYNLNSLVEAEAELSAIEAQCLA